jgi:hypothetical protein
MFDPFGDFASGIEGQSMLLEKARQHADEIRRAGAEAIKETLAAGVPVYYIDDRIGAGIIKEMPDGKRFRIEIAAGEEIVTESIAPRI